VKNPAAVDILIGLLPDEDVQGHAIAALRKLKPLKARPYLEPYTRHPNAWIRREAKGALMAIAKAHGEDSAG
jgi:HEAT repeat protein